MKAETVVTSTGHRLELVNLLDPKMNKLYNRNLEQVMALLENCRLGEIEGEFALVDFSRDEQRRQVFVGARTIGVPARVACQIVNDQYTRFIVAHTIGEIRDYWQEGLPADTGWVKPFSHDYTEMLPAFERLTIRPWAMRQRQYDWFLLGPPHAPYPVGDHLPPDLDLIGETYVETVSQIIEDQLRSVPGDEPIAVTLSGGADSALVATVLTALLAQGERRNSVCLMTLDLGGGTDVQQARVVAGILESRFGSDRLSHTVLGCPTAEIDVSRLQEEAALALEEYHRRDVECSMAGLLLSRATSASNLPHCCVCFDGDGGNETFRDYPIEGAVTLVDVLTDPHLYYLGYPRQKLAHNPVFSGGLSRAYTRTFNLARATGVRNFSPLVDRRVVDFGQRLPLTELVASEEQLYAIRGEAVSRGIRRVFGLEVPTFPKARFQEGCAANPSLLRVNQEDEQRLKQLVISHCNGYPA